MKRLKNITTLLFAFVLLWANLGLTLNHHYCGGHLVSTVAYVSKDNCCGNVEMPVGCCQNKVQYLHLDETCNLVFILNDITPDFLSAINNYPSEKLYLLPLAAGITQYLNYKPPLIVADIPVLFRSFLL